MTPYPKSRRDELEQQIAFRTRRIAEDTAVLHELLRQRGVFDVIGQLEVAPRSNLAFGDFLRSEAPPEIAAAKAPESADGPGPEPGHRSAALEREEYLPGLIDRARFRAFSGKLPDYKRATLLRMIEMLEMSHPAPVKASEINRSIEELGLCPKPTFSKLKSAFLKTGLVQFNGFNKTWNVPLAGTAETASSPDATGSNEEADVQRPPGGRAAQIMLKRLGESNGVGASAQELNALVVSAGLSVDAASKARLRLKKQGHIRLDKTTNRYRAISSRNSLRI